MHIHPHNPNTHAHTFPHTHTYKTHSQHTQNTHTYKNTHTQIHTYKHQHALSHTHCHTLTLPQERGSTFIFLFPFLSTERNLGLTNVLLVALHHNSRLKQPQCPLTHTHTHTHSHTHTVNSDGL